MYVVLVHMCACVVPCLCVCMAVCVNCVCMCGCACFCVCVRLVGRLCVRLHGRLCVGVFVCGVARSWCCLCLVVLRVCPVVCMGGCVVLSVRRIVYDVCGSVVDRECARLCVSMWLFACVCLCVCAFACVCVSV